ncbi:MAG: heparinase II/III family protein [Planctomycetes bacterium]|nr:heparinase II/III family protein [Planctomycetota bacterium]
MRRVSPIPAARWRFTLAAAVLWILAACGLSPVRAQGLDAARIETIAALLSERPAGFGRPIEDREAWSRIAEHAAFRDVVRRAAPLIDEPLPESPDDLYLDFSRTGNRSRWERASSRRRQRIASLVLAECIEHRGRFLKPLEETLRALCAERTWVLPAHDAGLANFKGETVDIDLGSASLGWNLATAMHLLGDRLSPEVRRLVGENLDRRIFAPYRDMIAGKRPRNWWLTTTNNWNAVCLAGVTGAALAVLEPREERALFVAAAEDYSRNFLRGFTPDGYCSEGLGYWNYGFGYYVLLAEAIHQATQGKVDLLGRDEVRAPARFGLRTEIADGVYPAFADCSVGSRPSSRILHFVSRRLGIAIPADRRSDPASPGGSLYDTTLYSFPSSASLSPEPPAAGGLPTRDWFEDAGVLICRPGQSEECRLAVALKGGHNAEHHNHNDVGSFVAVVAGRPVLVDPGAEVYTARTFSSRRYESKVLNSFGHPVPVVAGELQRPGRGAQARVLKTEFTGGADTLVLDLRSAYAVRELEKLARTFVYSREGAGSLTVIDEVEFSSPRSFATALVTLGEVSRPRPDELIIRDGEGAVRVKIEAKGAELSIREEEIEEDVRTRTLPRRIGIDLADPVREAEIRMTITPHGGEEPKRP